MKEFRFRLTDTSRPPRVLEEDGKGYWFTDREGMEEEIKNNKFLEYGEHSGNLYGTHLDSIRDVIKQGKFQYIMHKIELLLILQKYPFFNRQNVRTRLCPKRP